MGGGKGSLWLAVAFLVLAFVGMEVSDKVLLSKSGENIPFSLVLSTVKKVKVENEE